MGFFNKLFGHSPENQFSKDIGELKTATTLLFDLIDKGMVVVDIDSVASPVSADQLRSF